MPTEQNRIGVLAIAGSLRRHSFNHRLLEACAALAPPAMELVGHPTIGDLPLFNEDLETSGDVPDGVRRLRDSVEAADGLLIATPEYNQSLPGALKNAIDWLSRPDRKRAGLLEGKPVAIIGATTGPWGTRLAQSQLRHTLAATGARTLPAPMLFLRDAAQAYDVATGNYDKATQDRLHSVLSAFTSWIRLSSPQPNPSTGCNR